MQKKNNLIWIIVVAVLVFVGFPLAGACGYGIKSLQVYLKDQADKATITSSYLTSKLSEVSDLTTAELSYRGVVEYEEGNIPFLTKKGFTMEYESMARAGIDVSAVQIEVTDTSVIVTMPEAQIQTVVVNPDSMRIYDRQHSLLNWADQEDTVLAVQAAEENTWEYATSCGLTERARVQSETVIRGLFEDIIGDRELVFR